MPRTLGRQAPQRSLPHGPSMARIPPLPDVALSSSPPLRVARPAEEASGKQSNYAEQPIPSTRRPDPDTRAKALTVRSTRHNPLLGIVDRDHQRVLRRRKVETAYVLDPVPE